MHVISPTIIKKAQRADKSVDAIALLPSQMIIASI